MKLHIPAVLPREVSPPYQVAALIALFTVGLYLLRRWLLPRPIPGIPHNPEALRSLLGDIMAIQREMPDNIGEWVVRQSDRHRSPIYQVFLVPFSKPFVVVSDFREGQDILVRRKEFERSDLAIALLQGELPNFHACLKTGPVWAAHRRLLQDLMSPAFLNKVAAPNMYRSACRLLELWRIKCGIAGTGQPFSAHHDLQFSVLDAIFDFGYGDSAEDRALVAQLDLFKNMSEQDCTELRKGAGEGKPINFPEAPLGSAMDAVLRTTENITKVAVTGFPGMAWRVLAWIPSVRRMRKIKDKFIQDQVDLAVERLNNSRPEDGDSKLKCGLDLILQRERAFAMKEEREPVYSSGSIKDEVSFSQPSRFERDSQAYTHNQMFGFVTAGHETTAHVLAWGVKFMCDNPHHQDTLRSHLHAAHAAALHDGRFPTHEEITSANIPHLSAYIEEILRLSHAAAMTDRQCTEDTVVLGRPIPKGTTVVVVNKGPGYTSPNLPIDESLRSATSQRALLERKGVGYYAMFDEEGMGTFNPERWLTRDRDTGEVEFDATAYPSIPFGMGQRGCFGKRMVYVQFKMLVTLLLWQFEFLPCPEELSTYDSVQVLTNQPRKCYVALKQL